MRQHPLVASFRRSPWCALFLLAVAAACGDDPNPGSADAATDAIDASDAGDTAETSEDVPTDVADSGDADVSPDVSDTGADAPDDADGDSGEDADDGGIRVDEWPALPRTERDEGADADAWDPMSEPPADRAVVGRVRSGDRPFTGPEARCEGGDLVLANAHVMACIAGLDAPSQYTYQGGYLIDLAPGGDREGEMLEAVVPSEGLRNANVAAIEVLRDGADGGDAVVRTVGQEAAVAALGNFIGELITGIPLRFETEYRLGPEDRYVEAVTWVWPDAGVTGPRRVKPGDIVIAGDHVTAWVPGFGDIGARFGTLSQVWYGVSASRSYGVWSEWLEVGALAPGLLDSDIDPVSLTSGVIAPGVEATYVRRYAAALDTVGLDRAFGRTDAEAVDVAFSAPSGEAYPEPRYRISTASGTAVAVVRVDGSGTATAPLVPGDYVVTPWASPSIRTEFSVPTDGVVPIATAETGLLRVWVEEVGDGDPRPSPALARISGTSSAELRIERGSGALPLPPGTYAIEVSRGEEFTVDTISGVVVPAGGEVLASGSVRRVMDTTGWVSGDMHQHQRRSVDSVVENVDRVVSNLAAGVDFMAPSDHDAIEDFPRIVDEMGVGDLVFPFQGIEVSPAWGHLNAFPARTDRLGATRLSYLDGRTTVLRDGPELVAEARSLGARVIQVNHPRSSSSGYFGSSDYDPELGPSMVDSDYWPAPFDTVEVVNDLGLVCQVMRDWFSLLSRGMHITGVGNSDAHGIGGIGWPRNYLHVGTDAPSELDVDLLSDALLDGRVSVSGGIFLDFPDGELPGDMIAASAGEAFSIRVRLQTPTWLAAERIVVFVDGVEQRRIELTPRDASELVDFDDSIELSFDRDGYVVFWAEQRGRQSAVNPGKYVFGFTNPIFVDVGDDGWTAPGVAAPADVPTPTDLTFCPGA